MKKLSFLILISISAIHVFGQSEYREGFVIKQEGDTLWGYVNLAKKTVCHYKLQKRDKNHIAYQPGEIKGFGLTEGRYYESRPIKDEKSEKEMVVFMECLVKGSASLYTYKGRFFSEKADTAQYELTITKDKATSDESGNKYFENKRYIGMLSYLLRDCSGLSQSIQRVRLSTKDLTSLFTDYNKCSGASYIQYQEHMPWMYIKFGISAGIICSSIKFTSDGETLLGSPFKSTSGFIGSSVYFSWPRSIDRISMSLGLMYFSTNFHINDSYSYSTGTAFSEGIIKTNELKIPWGLHYTFSKKRLAPMIGAGIAGSLMLSNSTEFSWEYAINGEVQTSYFDLFQPDKFNTNYWASACAKYELKKNLELVVELRYDGPSNISDTYHMKVKYTHFSFSTGIRFK